MLFYFLSHLSCTREIHPLLVYTSQRVPFLDNIWSVASTQRFPVACDGFVPLQRAKTEPCHAGKPAISVSFLSKILLLCAVQDPYEKAGFARVLLPGLL